MSHYLYLNTIVLGLCAALCCWYLITRLEPIAITDENDSISDLDSKIIKNSVTNFRSSLIIITSVAILAVDFGIFKPEYAKTVYFGFSLMDIGVGYFILSHSMRFIRNSSDFEQTDRSLLLKINRTIKKSSILLILGLVRVFLVFVTGYHVDIAEYGLHWNFFFTIFAVKVNFVLFFCFDWKKKYFFSQGFRYNLWINNPKKSF